MGKTIPKVKPDDRLRLGRPRSIPQELFDVILTWHRAGDGYLSIAIKLRERGVNTSPSSVRRLIKVEGAYWRTS